MEQDIIILSVNAIAWILFFLIIRKHNKFANIGMLYYFFYMILAISAVHLYCRLEPNLYPWNKQNLFALLYLLAFIYLFCRPLMIFENQEQILVHPPKILMNVIYVCTIMLSLIGIVDIFNNFLDGFIKLMVDENYGNMIYQESTENFVHTAKANNSINIFGVIGNIAKGLSPLLLFYYLAEKEINKVIMVGLIISTFVTFMHSISMGIRSVLVLNGINFCMLFIYMKRFYTKKTLSKIKPILISLTVIISIGFASITYSRLVNSDNDPLAFVESYASQGFLYFGAYGFDNGDEIREGDRIFPLPKSLIDKNSARSTYERRRKYTKMYINESVFVTFVGDFVFDFGIFGGAFAMVSFLFIIQIFLKKNCKYVYFDQLLILYLNIYILSGFYLFPLSEFAGNILLFTILLLAIFFRINRTHGVIYK